MSLEDQQLTKNFSLFELTVTSNADLQEQNRDLTEDQITKLKALAQFAEGIRHLCGDVPVHIHSGYRCDAVNGATVGSSSTSQHPKCEAIDFDVAGQTVEQTFDILLQAAEAGKFCFGQLIIEAAQRDYGVAQWVHCSVAGSLEAPKIGQVMKATFNVGTKKFEYTLIKKLDFTE